MLPKISVVIPVYQNEGSVEQTYRAIAGVLDARAGELEYEFVLVNDGSRDRSWEILCRLHEERPDRVTLIDFTRNFGQVAAMLAGYRHASGDCVASVSADGQEPAELVWEMFCAWRQGHKLVVASRASREDGPIVDAVSRLGWGILRRHAVPGIPEGGFDVFLMDRQLCDFYVNEPERHIFIQGRLLFYGYQPFIVPYARRRRRAGKSQTSFGRKLSYFIDGFAAYSFLPLRLMSVVGLLLFVASLVISAVIAWYVTRYGAAVQGWASLMIVVLFLGGLQMLAIGILGEYLWRTLQETRRRPHYIIDTVHPASGDAARREPRVVVDDRVAGG